MFDDHKSNDNFNPSITSRPAGEVLFHFDWNAGYDGEYNYSLDIYPNCLFWYLEFDAQWSTAPTAEIQTFEDFIKNGPPFVFNSFFNIEEVKQLLK